jgi:hypothetical protein
VLRYDRIATIVGPPGAISNAPPEHLLEPSYEIGGMQGVPAFKSTGEMLVYAHALT